MSAIAKLVQDSSLPLSHLSTLVLQQLFPEDDVAPDLSALSVASRVSQAVVLLAERRSCGIRPSETTLVVNEDMTTGAHWKWDLLNSKYLPKNVVTELVVKRKIRKQVACCGSICWHQISQF